MLNSIAWKLSVPAFTKMANRYRKYGYKLIYTFSLSMIVTKLIFTDLVLAQTLFVNCFLLNCVSRRFKNEMLKIQNVCTRFHENLISDCHFIEHRQADTDISGIHIKWSTFTL
jgi:hypothetical protein